MKLPTTKVLPNLQGDWTASNTVICFHNFLRRGEDAYNKLKTHKKHFSSFGIEILFINK